MKFVFLRQKISSLAAAISLLAVLASGCSRDADKPALVARDLGSIQLRAGQPKFLDLGDRKECCLIASPATNDEFLVSVTINVRSYIGVVDKEQTKSASVTAHPGGKCVVRVGDTALQFMPELAAE